MQDLMRPERISACQQQSMPFEDGQPVQRNAHMVSWQPVQVHRGAVASNCRSHARRACGPSNRRNRGHMLTSDSRCKNRSRSSRWASARSRAYSARRWLLSATSYTRRPDQATCSGSSTSPAAGPFRSSREHGRRRAYSLQRGGKLPVSIMPIRGILLAGGGPSWAVCPRAAHHRAQVPRLALAPQPAAAGPHPQRPANRLSVPSSRSGAARCSIEPVARRSPAASRNLPPARCPGIPPPASRAASRCSNQAPATRPARPAPPRHGPDRRTAEMQLPFPLRLAGYPGCRLFQLPGHQGLDMPRTAVTRISGPEQGRDNRQSVTLFRA